ncbi:MAG: hypothetical protein H6553_00675 [Chitinophagales bacterium]|nr:hypothetical protein [Chitinophagales bacterium]
MKKINAFDGLYYACWLFISLTALAMLFYPGGKYANHNSVGYAFIENFFSDLGRFRTFNGGTKYISMVLFITAMVVLALSIIRFIFQFLKSIHDKKQYKIVQTIAIISAVAYGVLQIGIALTPYDLTKSGHMFFVRTCFITMVPVCWSFSFLIFKDAILPNRYFSLLLVVSLFLLGYIYILFYGPKMSDNIYFQPIAQKVIVYMLCFSLMYVAQGCRKYLKV